MNKDVEIGQINELKFYLAWDYVKDICNEAVRKENEQLHKFLEEFNALEVAEENQQLKELLKEIRSLWKGTICMPDSQEQVRDILTKIDNAIGEKK